MRLIDADKLKQRLPTFSSVIDEMPTIDAEPAKHGRWLSHFEYCKSHNYLPSGTSIPFWCSRCESAAKEKTLYCPNCGAKMDLKALVDNTDDPSIVYVPLYTTKRGLHIIKQKHL